VGSKSRKTIYGASVRAAAERATEARWWRCARPRSRRAIRHRHGGRASGEKGQGLIKYTTKRPFADPDIAARKLVEIASTIEPVQDGRIYIELLNGPFLFSHGGSPAEYGAGMKIAIERGWLVMHESGTFVRFTQAGADLFA
jgi:hypothetical protein